MSGDPLNEEDYFACLAVWTFWSGSCGAASGSLLLVSRDDLSLEFGDAMVFSLGTPFGFSRWLYCYFAIRFAWHSSK